MKGRGRIFRDRKDDKTHVERFGGRRESAEIECGEIVRRVRDCNMVNQLQVHDARETCDPTIRFPICSRDGVRAANEQSFGVTGRRRQERSKDLETSSSMIVDLFRGGT